MDTKGLRKREREKEKSRILRLAGEKKIGEMEKTKRKAVNAKKRLEGREIIRIWKQREEREKEEKA